MKKKLLALLLAGAMSVSLCACGGSSSSDTSAKSADGSAAAQSESDELVPMTLSFSTWVGYGPFFIADEKGFYEEQGLDVDPKIVDDEASFASLIGSNSVQALSHVIDREVINFASDIPETCIMVCDQSSGGDGIVASEEIQSATDLKGKTIGLNKSSTSYFYFLTVLEEAGLTEEDVTIKDMDADSAGTSFVQGQLDAAVTWEPWLTNANQREGGHLLCDSADYPNTIVDVVTVNDEFIAANPDKITGFIEAWNQAVDWYNDGNQEEGNQIIADGLGISVEDLESQLKGVTWYDRDSMKTFMDPEEDNNLYDVANRAIQFWADRELIDEAYDSADLITNEYLPE
ncbi:MAG: ABC transporter substrate-binding protein [Butyricicoccus sp.]